MPLAHFKVACNFSQSGKHKHFELEIHVRVFLKTIVKFKMAMRPKQKTSISYKAGVIHAFDWLNPILAVFFFFFFFFFFHIRPSFSCIGHGWVRY